MRNPFRRRRPMDDAGPMLVNDIWMAGGRPVERGWLSMAAATWTRRLGAVGSAVRRGMASAVGVGVEARSAERRSITTVPWNQGGPLSAAVSVERALQLSPVFAAGRLLASNVASLPLQNYRSVQGVREQIPRPSLLVSPSVQGTLHDWLFRCVTSLVYRGNAYGYITTRDSLGFPTGVEWLNPDWVQVIDSLPNFGQPGSYTHPIWYILGREVSAEDIVHIPWFTMPGKVRGLSPVGAYAATVSAGLSAQEFTRDWFDNGGVPPGTFANENAVVDQKDADIIKQRLVSAIRSHQPIVYGKDWKYTPITVSPNEAKFIETMRLTATQIAAIYGIPPTMIGGETGSSSLRYANVEQESINFVQFTLLPWLTKLETAFSALLPRGQYVKFNVDALIRPDTKTRYETYQIARNIGLRSTNELRALDDLPPVDGGDDYTPLALRTNLGPPAVRDYDRPRLVKDG